jgi:phage baseplate assembly protein W
MPEIPQNTDVYGYLPSPSVKKSVESKSLPIYGINFPIKKYSTDIYGREKVNKIFSKVTGQELTKCNLLQYLNTYKGERVMRPEFGLSLDKYVFSQIDENLFGEIAKEVFLQVQGYFPWIKIKSFKLLEYNKIEDVQAIKISLTVSDPTWGIEVFDMKVSIK